MLLDFDSMLYNESSKFPSVSLEHKVLMEDVGAHLKTSAGRLLARLKVEALLSIAEKLRSLQQAGQGKFQTDDLESQKLHL